MASSVSVPSVVSLPYSCPPHLDKWVAATRMRLLREAVDRTAMLKLVGEFEGDDTLYHEEMKRVAACEEVAMAAVPEAEKAVVAEVRTELAAEWNYARIQRENQPLVQYLHPTSAEDERLIELYFTLHRSRTDILSLSGERGTHGCSRGLEPEWYTATAHLSGSYMRSLQECGGELCYFRAFTDPALAVGDDNWRRIVHGATNAEMAADKAKWSIWEALEADYVAKGKSLALAFKGLAWTTKVDLVRFAKNKTVLTHITCEMTKHQRRRLMEEASNKNEKEAPGWVDW